MGLNINVHEKGTVLLIDEIESGLEPYRLRTLINELRNRFEEDGQIIMTTHSPTSLVELTIEEIFRVKSSAGNVTVLSPFSGSKILIAICKEQSGASLKHSCVIDLFCVKEARSLGS